MAFLSFWFLADIVFSAVVGCVVHLLHFRTFLSPTTVYSNRKGQRNQLQLKAVAGITGGKPQAASRKLVPSHSNDPSQNE
jgi:hypothetical protein